MTSNSSKTNTSGQHGGGVVLSGYYKKLKTMKNKYFVLYEECGKSQARLEYFDSEKKFKLKTNPKRSIILNSCLNINRRMDTKYDYVVTLSIKDGAFGIVMDSEEDMNKWLRAMLKLQNGQNIYSGPPRPYYEHLWQVVFQRRGLAEKNGILGTYHVCLSSKSITLIRIGSERTNIGEARVPLIEFYLTSIRRCGHSKCYFYMEVGRHSVIGAGELCMETESAYTALIMHNMILRWMSSNSEDPYGPMRKRSSSATETSKPVLILQRRQTHSGSKTMNSSPLNVGNRDRCDSLPSSRNRTNTEGGNNSFANASMPPSITMSSLNTVPNSTYNRHSHSPPVNNNALSPSVGCSESEGSTLSIDETDSMKHSLTPDENTGFVSRLYNSRSPGGVIPEENSDEFWYTENKNQNCIENATDLNKFNIHQDAECKKAFTIRSNIYAEEPESQNMDILNSISPFEPALCDTNLAGSESHFKSCNDSSEGNSRASSLAEEIVDGYVHMSPQTSDYVDMEQTLKNRRQMILSSARSNIPVNPLKDICFAEYPIEKVNSQILPDEGEMHQLNERPPRAYSVGSRMEHNIQKHRIEVLTNSDQNNCRVRAFSVGSRSKVPRCDIQRNNILTANSNNVNVTHSKTSIASIEPTAENTVRGRKSSSAPLLIHKSQNSVDRMEDLMEIDFSKNAGSRSNSLSSQSAGSSSYLINLPKASHLRSGALSTSPGKNIINHKSHNSFSEPIQFRADDGYLEMRPVIYSNSLGDPAETVDHFTVPNDNSISDLSETQPQPQQQHPDVTHNKLKLEEWTKQDTPEGYLEMSWNGKETNHFDQISNSKKHLMNELPKSRSPSSFNNIKKSRGVQKMPSINNRTTNNSKLSMLHTQNQNSNLTASTKSESSQRKRFFDHANSSFTISEEKITSIDQDTNISEKLKNLFLKLSLQSSEGISNAYVDLSTADTDCYDYVNFSAVPSKQMPSPKRAEIAASGKAKNRHVDNQSNESKQFIEKNRSSYGKGESHDINCILKKTKECTLNSPKPEEFTFDEGNKFSRKSSSPICTPTSPHSSSLRVQRFSNTNRPAKGTGYEILHIRSDSSLQTRKNMSRPSSVNSDSILPLETNQYRPNSVNSDCLQLDPVPSSKVSLGFTSLLSSRNCDNRVQDPQLTAKPVPITNNSKQKNTDSVSSRGLQQHIVANDLTAIMSSPATQVVAQCQPELGLHYASLDLPVSSTTNSNTTIHGARSSTSDDTSTSLSPNSNTAQQSAFTYAKIDFKQCEAKKFKCTQNNL